MNVVEKIKRSWWVILSFILFLNGSGFIYIGTKHNNRNWILEGILYELPWFIYLCLHGKYGNPVGLNVTGSIVFLSFILMFIGIIRSFWVAVKLADVYDNEEKYTIQTTVLKKDTVKNNGSSGKLTCCACIIVIFIIFMIIAF